MIILNPYTQFVKFQFTDFLSHKVEVYGRTNRFGIQLEKMVFK